MFEVIQKMLGEAGLSGCNINVKKSSGTKISVILSFAVGVDAELESKLFQKQKTDTANTNADRLVTLRSALSSPLVVTCEPCEVPTAFSEALNQISQGYVEAATVYSTTDINALLNAASSAVKSQHAGKAKSTTESTAQTDDDHLSDDQDGHSADDETGNGTSGAKSTAAFDEFDSL